MEQGDFTVIFYGFTVFTICTVFLTYPIIYPAYYKSAVSSLIRSSKSLIYIIN